MTKQEMDIQLIEACVLEKWNPMAMGCRVTVDYQVKDGDIEAETCCLCQIYLYRDCAGCPVKMNTGKKFCEDTPFRWAINSMDRIEAEIEFLISLLPETHPWRNI